MNKKPPSQEKLIFFGKVLRPQGNKGEVRILPFGPVEDLVQALEAKELFLSLPQQLEPMPVQVEAFRQKKNLLVIKFAHSHSLHDAEALRDAQLGIPVREQHTLLPEYFSHDQLIGLEVRQAKDAQPLGNIIDLAWAPGKEFLVLEHQGREVLIPATPPFIQEIKLDESVILVDLPEGLLELP